MYTLLHIVTQHNELAIISIRINNTNRLLNLVQGNISELRAML